MPIHAMSKAALELNQDGFICANQDDIEIYGDWNSEKARSIYLTLYRCQGHDYCKTDEQITQFLKGKYLLLLHNQIRFDPELYGIESIIRESRIKWISISTQMQQEFPFVVTMSELQLQDLALDLDSITELEDSSVFRLDSLSPRSAEAEGSSLVSQLSFQMNFDVVRLQRDGYTLIDILSDIGGMEAILISGISLFLSLWNYKHFDSHMASNLYKLPGDERNSHF